MSDTEFDPAQYDTEFEKASLAGWRTAWAVVRDGAVIGYAVQHKGVSGSRWTALDANGEYLFPDHAPRTAHIGFGIKQTTVGGWTTRKVVTYELCRKVPRTPVQAAEPVEVQTPAEPVEAEAPAAEQAPAAETAAAPVRITPTMRALARVLDFGAGRGIQVRPSQADFRARLGGITSKPVYRAMDALRDLGWTEWADVDGEDRKRLFLTEAARPYLYDAEVHQG